MATVVDPSHAGVVEMLAADRAARRDHEAEKRREADEGKRLAKIVEQWLDDLTDAEIAADRGTVNLIAKRNYYQKCPVEPQGTTEEVRRLAYGCLSTAVVARARQRVKEIEAREAAERRAAKEAEAAERRAAKEAERRERNAWIQSHGSTRLQRMVVEGIDCEKTYRAERERYEEDECESELALRYPGWHEAPETPSAVANVPDSAFAILDAGRRQIADCRLAQIGGRYVCVAEFRGRTIYYPRD